MKFKITNDTAKMTKTTETSLTSLKVEKDLSDFICGEPPLAKILLTFHL